ncbi:hypothetical protein [Paenibacillus sp. ACRRY]|uniref:hypothetical protein n=1 Tax=Paenibacillus sp. ACRRY TaxID=2918208 RepID=UPI001EF407FD|nr:hypothetical protein [Paenibacillus sp. ACRRY]MCG7385561.1 hypothetical protein [Paenibacillus sp. ACRRY]
MKLRWLMYRYHFRAQCRENMDPMQLFHEALPILQIQTRELGAHQLSLFHFGTQLFLYYESPVQSVDPHELFAHCEDALEIWPGTSSARRWVPMIDIFHYHKPVSEKQWLRQNASARPYARIAHLKPDQVASYVFYHYQYQEEKPGDGDKYGIIALHENLMFFYSEDPATIEKPSYSGKLSTSHTPSDWAGTMEPHFIPWDSSDGNSPIWLEIPLVIRV